MLNRCFVAVVIKPCFGISLSLLCLIFVEQAIGQGALTATLTDGTGGIYGAAYLHFQLQGSFESFCLATGVSFPHAHSVERFWKGAKVFLIVRACIWMAHRCQPTASP